MKNSHGPRILYLCTVTPEPNLHELLIGALFLPKVTAEFNGGTINVDGDRNTHLLRNDRGEIVLLIVYAKAKFDNLSAQFLKRLKEACDGS